MVIDFLNMEEKPVEGFKGGTGITNLRKFENDLGKIIMGRPGATIGLHTHETNSEAIYIISGNADFIYDDGTEVVGAGGCHYCPKGHCHSMINNGKEDIVFFAVVSEQ